MPRRAGAHAVLHPTVMAMDRLDSGAIRLIAQRLRWLMDEHRDRLLELDRAIGDGDLGLTMTRAFAAAEEAAAADEPLPGRLLVRMGMAMAKAARPRWAR